MAHSMDFHTNDLQNVRALSSKALFLYVSRMIHEVKEMITRMCSQRVLKTLHLYPLLLRQILSPKVLPMSVDRTGSNANNPDSLATVESPLAASSVHGPSTSTHASPTSVSVGPSASAPASPSISAPAGLSVTATTSPSVSGGNPSVSAPANPSISTPVAGHSISAPFTGASIYIPVAGPSVSTPVAGPSVSTPVAGPAFSASAGPSICAPALPSAHENNRHNNTPSFDKKNAGDQEQVNNVEKFIQIEAPTSRPPPGAVHR
ncbi:hypothetical protein K435DRAFT_799929 [Dendrothele bispora CBS 962.96]|uniref:Uncharacterized protein n=1 Tax=Dendrothele bispora (strain CBS 962.96) TaxID=1314807 RepID=A0A4S8LUB3_DENBC|nr:hypothetical protein K435DRAFT_799929 [Dendrothele bispora CBS 962.96]